MDNDNFTPDEFAEKADEVKSEIEKISFFLVQKCRVIQNSTG